MNPTHPMQVPPTSSAWRKQQAVGILSAPPPSPVASSGKSSKRFIPTLNTGKGNMMMTAGTPDFVKCVTAIPFVPSLATTSAEPSGTEAEKNPQWYQLEWQARAMYWQEQAETLGFKADHYKQKSASLASQLGFCTQVLQNQTEQNGKDQTALLERLHVVQAENSRLASLLGTYISKAQAYDELKDKIGRMEERERLSMEEKASMQAVLGTMSDTLTCFLRKDQSEVAVTSEEDEEAACNQFCGEFFVNHPCDGPNAGEQ